MQVREWFVGDPVPKVYVNGHYRMPGVVARGRDGLTEFRMRSEKGDVLKSDAIALSVTLLNYLEDKRGVQRIVVWHQRHLYSVSTAVLRNRQYVVGTGTQQRFALEMSAWSVDGQTPGTRQPGLPFAPEQPPTEPSAPGEPHSPLVLGIPKPAEGDWPERKDIE